MTTIYGRGAWTSRGGTTPFYELTSPAVGSTPEKNADCKAVTLGVKAYQLVFNGQFGYNLETDGWWGPATTAVAKAVQAILKITADGIVGPATSKSLALIMTRPREAKYRLPTGVLCGLVKKESAFDFGAVGYTTSSDKGLVQINLSANPAVTEEQAFNPYFALDYAGARLLAAFNKYGRWDCACASYNSPLWARQWYESGAPPNERIASYVSAVLSGC